MPTSLPKRAETAGRRLDCKGHETPMTTEETLARLRELVEACRNASFRDRRQPAREAGYLALQLEKSEPDISLQDLKVLADALAFAARHQTYGGKWQASLRRVVKRQREIAGVPDPVTIAETAKTLDVEAGSVLLHEAASEPPAAFFESGTSTYRTAREDGLFFDIGLSMDCRVMVRLRYVEADQPELTLKELGRVTSATPLGFLNCPSLTVTAHGCGVKSVQVQVGSPTLLVCGFLVGYGRKQEIICVCCPSNGSRPGYQEADLDLY